MGLDEASTRFVLANLYLGKGLWRDATTEFQHLAQYFPQPLFHEALGELCLVTEPPQYDASETHLLKALALAHEIGDQHREASANFGLGWLHLLLGDRPGAAQHLRDSYDLYKPLGLIDQADTVWSTMIRFDLHVP